MRCVLRIVALFLAASTVCAIAAPLAYHFDFAATDVSGQFSFWYDAPSATPPGTGLPDVQTSAGLIFPLLASRESSGEWSFHWMGSPTFSFTLTALTDVSFPNSPGMYLDVPSEVIANVMFETRTALGTVDIRIEQVPEPGTPSLVLCGVILMSALRWPYVRQSAK